MGSRCIWLLLAIWVAGHVALSAQEGPPWFLSGQKSPSGGGWGLAADLDGDRDLDYVSIDPPLLWRNNGHGAFREEPAGEIPVWGWEYYIYCYAQGDVDGDGDLDLVLGLGNDIKFAQQNRLLLNRGDGRFLDATAGRLPAREDQTISLALGDVDGDGDLDLLVGNLSDPRLCLNDGRGFFADAPAGTWPPADYFYTRCLAFGDFDGDGDLDLLMQAHIGFAGYGSVLFNDGRGRFRFAPTYPQWPWCQPDLNGSWCLAVGDMDGDGDLDVIVPGETSPNNPARPRIYLNRGWGEFLAAPPDTLILGPEITDSLALGDVDGDGDLDLLVCDFLQARLHLNDGTGIFREATAARLPVDRRHPLGLTFGDVDGDGDLDLLGAGRLFLNDGRGFFIQATPGPIPFDRTGYELHAQAVGDVNGDGSPDLILGFTDPGAASYYSGDFQNRMYLNDGRGRFRAAPLPAAEDPTTGLALGDVDGDGDLDLVVGNGRYVHKRSLPGQNRLLVNDGKGGFRERTAAGLPRVEDTTGAVGLADLDGDGDLDLVVANSGATELLVNDGSGRFKAAGRLPAGADIPAAMVLADLDGDGFPDLLVGYRGDTAQGVHPCQNRLYRNDRRGRFLDVTGACLPDFPDTTTALAAGDVDGDGDKDLVIGNGDIESQSQERCRLLRNDGRGYFTDAPLPLVPGYTVSLQLWDQDADGDLDLLVGGMASPEGEPGMSNTAPAGLYLNDGRGIFTAASGTGNVGVAAFGRHNLLADLDGDGDADLLVDGAMVYWNTTHQVNAPFLARTGNDFILDLYARTPGGGFTWMLPFLAGREGRLPLAPFGVFGLEPSSTLLLRPALIPPAAGRVTRRFFLPALPALAGREFFLQGLALHGLRHPLANWRFTNLVCERIWSL